MSAKEPQMSHRKKSDASDTNSVDSKSSKSSKTSKASKASDTSELSGLSVLSGLSSRSASSRSVSSKTTVRHEREVMPHNISELLRKAKEKEDEGFTKNDIIQWIYNIAQINGIRIRNDEHPSDFTEKSRTKYVMPLDIFDHKTSKSRSSANKKKKQTLPVPIHRDAEGKSFIVIEQILDPNVIVASYNQRKNIEPTDIDRIILSYDKTHGKHNIPLCGECNGIVICTQTWKALAVPPRAFNHNFDNSLVNQFLKDDKYDLILVEDGTVVTVYCWELRDKPVWCIASSNGYDVSSYRWMGPKTFAEIIWELSAMYPDFREKSGIRLIREEKKTRLSFDNFDKGKSYSFGFRHHNFHPLVQDPQRMWAIQTVDLASGETRYGQIEGLPSQITLDNKQLSAGKNISVEFLSKLCKDALERANSAKPDKKLMYGFILRSNDIAKTLANSDILIESPLLKSVKKSVYERPPLALKKHIDHQSRLEFNALRSFLNLPTRNRTLMLFPSWKKKFDDYSVFIQNLTKEILTMHRTSFTCAVPNRTFKGLKALAAALLSHIVKHVGKTFNPFKNDKNVAESIVHDFIVMPQYTFLYLEAMKSAKVREDSEESFAITVSTNKIVENTGVVDIKEDADENADKNINKDCDKDKGDGDSDDKRDEDKSDTEETEKDTEENLIEENPDE